jgi:hypothetical protein
MPPGNGGELSDSRFLASPNGRLGSEADLQRTVSYRSPHCSKESLFSAELRLAARSGYSRTPLNHPVFAQQ